MREPSSNLPRHPASTRLGRSKLPARNGVYSYIGGYYSLIDEVCQTLWLTTLKVAKQHTIVPKVALFRG